MKHAMEQEQIQKNKVSNTRFWIVWGIAALAILGGLGFYGWKAWTLDKENKRFEVSIENTQKRLQALAPGTEEILKKQNEVLKRAQKFRTKWSGIMEQIVALETPAVRFANIGLSGERVSASCQATSWKGLGTFIETLEKNPRVTNVRISNTSVLSPPIAGAGQSASVTFNFSPKAK